MISKFFSRNAMWSLNKPSHESITYLNEL